MKRLVFSFLVYCAYLLPIQAQTAYDKCPRISAINEQGYTLWYGKLSDHAVVLVPENTSLYGIVDDETDTYINYAEITTDTLIVPESISYEGDNYTVTHIGPMDVFFGMNITTLYLPKTIAFIGDTIKYSEYLEDPMAGQLLPIFGDANNAFRGAKKLQKVHIDDKNPHFTSIDGIVYTKDLKNLVLYPRGRKETYYAPVEGCEHILRSAFYNSKETSVLRQIEFPNSLQSIGHFALQGNQLEKVIFKDNIVAVGMFNGFWTDELHIGKGITRFFNLSIIWDAIKRFYCYPSTPPILEENSLMNKLSKEAVLFVPRNSIKAYATAGEWNRFENIYPIEPPIVTGVNEAEVTWAQDFSATGYTWTLYRDEAQQNMVMTLVFDQDGHLERLIMGGGLAPARIIENGDDNTNDNEDEPTEDKRFAEYYTFTIENLSSDTKYYYVHQALSGDEVIREESGDFATLPSTPTAVEDVNGGAEDNKTMKVICAGQVYIIRDGKLYDMTGRVIE